MSDAPAKCLGKWHPSLEGDWFDCEHEFAGEATCDDCIFGANGGRYDPRRPLEEQMSDKRPVFPYDNLEFDKGDLGEGYPWSIQRDMWIQNGEPEGCPHECPPTPEQQAKYDAFVAGLTGYDASWPYPYKLRGVVAYVVHAKNEGGCRGTSVCLQCILAGAKQVVIEDVIRKQLEPLIGMPVSEVMAKIRGMDMVTTEHEVLERYREGKPSRQELLVVLRELVDHADNIDHEQFCRSDVTARGQALLKQEDDHCEAT